ncbi:MAG TPA: serine hydrolase domain-containing protein [Acidimicrobiales bacterium]|nr:serine hydrolase domain-containing protein [Acidimicrobiales bacterium]
MSASTAGRAGGAIAALVARARRDVDEGLLPACQVAVARHGELLAFDTFGAPPGRDRFVMWSCSKAITAAAAWQVAGEGALDLTARVVDYVPEFGTFGKDVVTVEQLLLHTAGFPHAPMGPQYWGTSEGRRHAFSRWRLNWEPGTRYEYHALSAHWVVAEILTAVTGRDHRDLVTERVAAPLGLDRLRLGVPEPEQADIVDLTTAGTRATDADWAAAGLTAPPPPPVELPPEAVLFLNAPAAREAGIPAGGAVSTAGDLALLYQAFLTNPGDLWNPEVLADGTGTVRNTFPDEARWGIPANRTRGIVVRGDDEGAHWRMHFGPGTSPRTFGHDGAGGQIAWADPATGISFAYLTAGMEQNRVVELRRGQELSALAAAVAGS